MDWTSYTRNNDPYNYLRSQLGNRTNTGTKCPLVPGEVVVQVIDTPFLNTENMQALYQWCMVEKTSIIQYKSTTMVIDGWLLLNRLDSLVIGEFGGIDTIMF